MYFPYLRSRGEELGAISETKDCRNIIPIIELYSDEENENDGGVVFSRDLIKTIKELVSNNKRFVCIFNSPNELKRLEKTVDNSNFYEYCICAFFGTFYDLKEIKYGAIVHNNENCTYDSDKILYHFFMPEIKNIYFVERFPRKKSVNIIDSFIKKERNADYGERDNFESMCYLYREYGLGGFGDFTILPKNYIVGTGGDQNQVTHTIHLTKEKENKELEVRHFLTTPEEETGISERSIATLKKAYNARSEFINSRGMEMIEEKAISNSSTSLGRYKRIGIIHHITLMNKIEENNI